MTTDAESNVARPDRAEEVAASQNPAIMGAQPLKDGSERQLRPNTFLSLIEIAYGQQGRKLKLISRDFGDLSVDPATASDEDAAIRRFAATDPFLEVPPSLLAAVAEHEVKGPVLGRILELVGIAFESHMFFGGQTGHLTDSQGQSGLTARAVFDVSKGLTFNALGLSKTSASKRPNLKDARVNAVTTVSLLRVLRGSRTLEPFVNDMAEFVWNARAENSIPKTAALLATANNVSALSELSRHFEDLLRVSRRQTDEAQTRAGKQERLTATAQATSSELSEKLEAEKRRAAELVVQVEELTQRLNAEQASRVADKSHHVDDYEDLRTQVIRRLERQSELLGNGLHALRNGRTSVAEEFVDRALSTIDSEVARLRGLNGVVK